MSAAERRPRRVLAAGLLAALALIVWFLGRGLGEERAPDEAAREEATSEAGTPASAAVPALGGSGTRDDPGSGDAIDPEDERRGIVRGHVSRAGEEPDGPGRIRVSVEGTDVARTVADGPFEVRYSRGADSPVFWISSPGFRTRRWTLTQPVADLGEVVLLPSPGYGGRVLEREKAVAGAIVRVYRSDGSLLATSGPSVEDGRYWASLDDPASLSADPAGGLPDLHLRVESARTLFGPFEAQVAGLQGAHDLRLFGAARLTLIDESDRRPIVGAAVRLSKSGPHPTSLPVSVHSATTDEKGSIDFPRPTWTGELVASVTVRSLGAFDVFLDVTPGWSGIVLRLDLRAVVDVPLRVDREDGSPARGARVGATLWWGRSGPPRDGREMTGVAGAEGDLFWRVLLPARDAYLVPLRWSVLLPGAKTPESGEFRPDPLPAWGPLPRIRLGERRSHTQRIQVVEEPSGLPVVPARGFLRLFHTGQVVAEGPVRFSATSESGPEGPVWEMRLPAPVVRALDEKLMFDAPVLHLEVEGRAARTVPLRVRDFTEGLRRDVLLVARVPPTARSAVVRVVAERLRPVPGAIVALVPKDGAGGAFEPARAKTGPSGDAVFGDLERGSYEVVAYEPVSRASGWARLEENRTEVGVRPPDREQKIRLRLTDGGSPRWATLTLQTVPPGVLPTIVVPARNGSWLDVPAAPLDAYQARLEAGAGWNETTTHRLVGSAAELRNASWLEIPPAR